MFDNLRDELNRADSEVDTVDLATDPKEYLNNANQMKILINYAFSVALKYHLKNIIEMMIKTEKSLIKINKSQLIRLLRFSKSLCKLGVKNGISIERQKYSKVKIVLNMKLHFNSSMNSKGEF